MNQKFNTVVLGIGALFFVVGLIVLFSATNFGMMMAQNAITSNAGSMETEKYDWIMQSNALSFQISGGILSAFGGLSVLLAGYRWNKK